jgi:hypothetical protein
MSREDEAKDQALLMPLSEAARRVAAEDAGAGPAPEAWHRLRQARDRGPTRAVTARRWALTVVAAVGLSLVVGGWVARHPRPLTFVVSGGQVEANGYVLSAGPAATELRFSDGTRVRLARGTRMSVGAPGPRGARLRVEDGQAHFEVTHRPGADWSVEAGPYRVQVTGTVFDVRWSGTEEAATVALRVGSVRVTGPHLAAPLTLAAEQRLVANLTTSAVRIEAGSLDGDTPSATPAPATAPSLPVPPPPTDASSAQVVREAPARDARPAWLPTPTRVVTHAFAPDQWSRRVASGESAAVLAEARARIFDDVIGSVDAAALGALADAARYSGERGLSTRALTELRRRFPTSAEARTAAFQLGRMADDDDDANAALTWYRRYAEETPRGPYAAEAIGREMLAVERLSGRPAAAPLARAYLARFPEGTYLLQARAILGLP